MKQLKRMLPWLLLALWCAVIFLFSCQNAEESGALSGFLTELLKRLPGLAGTDAELVETVIRKGAHVAEYAILALLALNAFCHAWPENGWSYAAALGFSVLYAATDEFHQYLGGSRTGQPLDVAIDTCGAVAALLIVLLCGRLRRRSAS